MRFMPKNASRWLSRIAAIAAIVVIGGCQTATFPDPNAVPIESMTIVQRQILLKATSDDLVERQTQGRLPEALTQKLISLRARELAPGLDKVKYAPSEAWRYGEFFVAAKMWKEAKAALLIAVAQPHKQERWMVDRLRLARAQANLGEIDAAVATVRSTFSIAVDFERPPILPAVSLEIAPEGAGKGHDEELGDLVLAAIDQCKRATAPPNEGGKAFFAIRPFQIKRAYLLAASLYEAARKPEKAAKAIADRQTYAAVGSPERA